MRVRPGHACQAAIGRRSCALALLAIIAALASLVGIGTAWAQDPKSRGRVSPQGWSVVKGKALRIILFGRNDPPRTAKVESPMWLGGFSADTIMGRTFQNTFWPEVIHTKVLKAGGEQPILVRTWQDKFGRQTEPHATELVEFARSEVDRVVKCSRGEHSYYATDDGDVCMIGVNLTGLPLSGSTSTLNVHPSWGAPHENPKRWMDAGYEQGKGLTDYEIALCRQAAAFPYVRWFEEHKPGRIRQLDAEELLGLGITPLE